MSYSHIGSYAIVVEPTFGPQYALMPYRIEDVRAHLIQTVRQLTRLLGYDTRQARRIVRENARKRRGEDPQGRKP